MGAVQMVDRWQGHSYPELADPRSDFTLTPKRAAA
jgi:hypothetical protein